MAAVNKGKPTWEATQTRHDRFVNLVSGKEQTVGAWQDEMKADRARRRGTTGVWNSKTGRREGQGYGKYWR